MQDRLKFRAYWTETNEMIYDIQDMCNFKDWLQQTDTDPIMQCTGLHDKNGRLVYFDDIVETDDGLVWVVKQELNVRLSYYGKVIGKGDIKMSEYCKNCYKLQTKLDKVKDLSEQSIDRLLKPSYYRRLELIQKALEVINEKI